MRKVHFVDTSVLLNLLDVPNRNADAVQVKDELRLLVQRKETIILPVASIIETGNHIAHVDDGRIRRGLAQKFGEFLRDTADGKAPWRLSSLAWGGETLHWFADNFTDYASGEVGIGDLSIIHEFNTYLLKTPGVSARIWSTDGHMQGYDHAEREIGR